MRRRHAHTWEQLNTYPFDVCMCWTNIDWKSAVNWSLGCVLFFGCNCSSISWLSMRFWTSFAAAKCSFTESPPPFVCRAKRWWGFVAVVVCVWSLTSLMIGRGDEAWAGEEIDDWRWLTGSVNAGAIATDLPTFGLEMNKTNNLVIDFFLCLLFSTFGAFKSTVNLWFGDDFGGN